MAIAQKPKKPDEAKIMSLIEKGLDAPTSADQKSQPAKAKVHPLRFPPERDLWDRLEAAISSNRVKLPRNTYILQAIHEKLEADGF